jgi:hypothetical protein
MEMQVCLCCNSFGSLISIVISASYTEFIHYKTVSDYGWSLDW